MRETTQPYLERILGRLEGKDPLRVQRSTAQKLTARVKGLDHKLVVKRPAPEKWSIAEILAHLADSEVVAAWRLRSIPGQNAKPIQALDQDVRAQTFNCRGRDPKASLELFRALWKSNLARLQSVPKNLWEHYGMHQERGKETIAHLLRLFAGHDLNPLQQVERIRNQDRRPTGADSK